MDFEELKDYLPKIHRGFEICLAFGTINRVDCTGINYTSDEGMDVIATVETGNAKFDVMSQHNVKTHKFKHRDICGPDNFLRDFECTKCGCKLLYLFEIDDTKIYASFASFKGKPWLVRDQGNLSCEEYIVKDIIQ